LLLHTVSSRKTRYTIAALGVLLLATACGASTTAPGSESTTKAATSAGSSVADSSAAVSESEPTPLNLNLAKDETIAAALPDKYKQSGTIVVATDATYAPNEFLAEGSNDPIGMDIDLANALGQVLGLKVTVEPASFDGIIPGINAGRYDMSLSSFTDTKEREASVNFVTYFEAGTSTMVLAGNPQNINAATDLCGRPVGAENSTIQLAQLKDATVTGSVVKACADAGNPRRSPRVTRSRPTSTPRWWPVASTPIWPTARSWPMRSSRPATSSRRSVRIRTRRPTASRFPRTRLP